MGVQLFNRFAYKMTYIRFKVQSPFLELKLIFLFLFYSTNPNSLYTIL